MALCRGRSDYAIQDWLSIPGFAQAQQCFSIFEGNRVVLSGFVGSLIKLRGFRVTDADGNATDFYIDPSTAYISEYLFQYQRYNFGSTISKFREVDGVLIPTSFTQRFDMPAEAVLTSLNIK